MLSIAAQAHFNGLRSDIFPVRRFEQVFDTFEEIECFAFEPAGVTGTKEAVVGKSLFRFLRFFTELIL